MNDLIVKHCHSFGPPIEEQNDDEHPIIMISVVINDLSTTIVIVQIKIGLDYQIRRTII